MQDAEQDAVDPSTLTNAEPSAPSDGPTEPSTPSAEPSALTRWAPTLLALALGAACAWTVTEQDIFWQIRAGEDLVRLRAFPQIDSWSFTAAGKPWWNVQWLSTLLFAALYHLGGAPALVLGRVALVACWMGVLAATIRAVVPRARVLTTCLTLLPLFWTALSFRLELRSDTLVFVVFAEIVRRFHRGTLRRWQLPCFVMLAANLHVGTAPFVSALAIYLTLLDHRSSWRSTLGLTLASCAALFVTPYHVRVLTHWTRHFFYSAHTTMYNPDHQPLAWRHFEPSVFGLHGWAWLALSTLAVIGFLATPPRRSAQIPANVMGCRDARRERWLGVLGFVLLTAMCANRLRVLPYQLMFLTPHLARTLTRLIAKIPRAHTLATAGAAIAVSVTVHELTHGKLEYGLSLSPRMYPIGSAAFIAREQLTPNLFQTFAFGAYTVYALRDYKDFVDTRETMFDGLQTEILEAYASPALTQRMMDRYGINVSMVPIPKTALVAGLGYRNAITEYLPKEQWALVYFDDISVVVVRRIPEHASVIERHEYRYLYPNLPPGNFLRMRPDASKLARYREEVERCLHDEPTNAFCMQTRDMLTAP